MNTPQTPKDIKIITNNQPRALNYSPMFDDSYFEYRGTPYWLEIFMHTRVPGWDGIMFETVNSGVMFKFLPAYDDYVIVGRFSDAS